MFNCWVGDWGVAVLGAVVGADGVWVGDVWVGAVASVAFGGSAINRGDVTSNILGIKSFERYLQIPQDM